MAALLAVGGAYAVASVDWCGAWPDQPPAVLGMSTAQGPLSAGAAEVELVPPYPVVAGAGYGPRRPEATTASAPLMARALVLQVESVKVGIVSLDLVTAPASVVEAVRRRAEPLGLTALLVTASHTHSSFGGYDPQLLAQIAALGRFRPDVLDAVSAAAGNALEAAAKAQTPATMRLGRGESSFSTPRTGSTVDNRLTRFQLDDESGEPLAQLILLAAHPTVVKPKQALLDPDYPSAVSALARPEAGVTLVLQGAAGNASVADPSSGPTQVAHNAWSAVKALPLEAPESPLSMGVSRVAVTLPRPDSSRLVSRWVHGPSENLICHGAPRQVELTALRLGPVELLAIPAEVTASAGARLEEASGADRLLTLANGYIGYVESRDLLDANAGEAKRQYFSPELLEKLVQGASVAGQLLKFEKQSAPPT
jgi:hypothetical protein